MMHSNNTLVLSVACRFIGCFPFLLQHAFLLSYYRLAIFDDSNDNEMTKIRNPSLVVVTAPMRWSSNVHGTAQFWARTDLLTVSTMRAMANMFKFLSGATFSKIRGTEIYSVRTSLFLFTCKKVLLGPLTVTVKNCSQDASKSDESNKLHTLARNNRL